MEKQDAGEKYYSPATKNGRKTTLLSFHELEPWQQDNAYILTSYRPLSHSYTRSLLSLSYLHNQTVNIYTHLIGVPLFALAAHRAWTTLSPLYASATHEDFVVFACFFAGLLACLSCSALFHTFANHSRLVHERWLLLDFLGILALIAGSWVPGVYYGFYCQRSDARFYLTLVCIHPLLL